MPAGPIGSVWASGTWSNTAWEANTWANAAAFTQATILGDLSTMWMTEYVPELKAAHPTALDVDTLIANDVSIVRAIVADRDDANTMYAIYLSST